MENVQVYKDPNEMILESVARLSKQNVSRTSSFSVFVYSIMIKSSPSLLIVVSFPTTLVVWNGWAREILLE